MTNIEPRRVKKITRKISREEQGAYESAETLGKANHPLITATRFRIVEGYVTLTQLAAERAVQAQLARLWLKRAGVKKLHGWRWQWKEGSKDLPRVRKTLGLKP